MGSHYHDCYRRRPTRERWKLTLSLMRYFKQESHQVCQANVSCETNHVGNNAKYTLHHRRNIQRRACLNPLEPCQLKPGVPPEHRPCNRSIRCREQCQQALYLHQCGGCCYTPSRCIKHLPETSSAGILDAIDEHVTECSRHLKDFEGGHGNQIWNKNHRGCTRVRMSPPRAWADGELPMNQT